MDKNSTLILKFDYAFLQRSSCINDLLIIRELVDNVRQVVSHLHSTAQKKTTSLNLVTQ